MVFDGIRKQKVSGSVAFLFQKFAIIEAVLINRRLDIRMTHPKIIVKQTDKIIYPEILLIEEIKCVIYSITFAIIIINKVGLDLFYRDNTDIIR